MKNTSHDDTEKTLRGNFDTARFNSSLAFLCPFFSLGDLTAVIDELMIFLKSCKKTHKHSMNDPLDRSKNK